MRLHRLPGIFLIAGLSLAISSAIFFSGCDRGPQLPKTYPVRGRVEAKNGKDYRSGRVTFQNVADRTILGDALLADDLTFVVETKMYGKDKPGLPEGEYQVMVEQSLALSNFQVSMDILKDMVTVKPEENAFVLELPKK